MKTAPSFPSSPPAGSEVPDSPAAASANRHICPNCGGRTLRVPRQLLDHLFSLVTPLHRHRCRNAKCQWEGTIPGKSDVADRHYYLSTACAKLPPVRKDD